MFPHNKVDKMSLKVLAKIQVTSRNLIRDFEWHAMNVVLGKGCADLKAALYYSPCMR